MLPFLEVLLQTWREVLILKEEEGQERDIHEVIIFKWIKSS